MEQLKTIGRELAMGSQGGFEQSKEFMDLVKSIGEARSKAPGMGNTVTFLFSSKNFKTIPSTSASTFPFSLRTLTMSVSLRDGVQLYPVGLQVLPAAFLPVDEDDNVGDCEAGGAEWGGVLEDGGAAGDEVLDDEAGLVGGEVALNGLGSVVVLDLLAAYEHGGGGGEGEGGGDGEGGVGDAADKVVAGGGDGGDEGLGDVGEEGRVGDDEAEVDVDWGGDARFQLEVAEFHGGDLVKLQD